MILILRSRKIAVLAASLFLTGSHIVAQEKPENPQNQAPPQKRETSGTKKDVEKRLKAAEKSKVPAPLDEVVNALFAAHEFQMTAISPDGTKVAWVETLTGKTGAPSGDTAIFTQDIKSGAKPRRISADPAGSSHAEGSVAWSPDGKKVAFLSDAEKKGQFQLYVTSIASGPARKLTSVKGFLAAPGWSPDGKTIALLFTENASRAAGPLVAETPETGEIKDAFFEQRLALIDLATGKLRQISPADTYIYEYDWSPDGARFAVTAVLGNGDNNWYIAELYTLDASTGLMKSIYKPKWQMANPAWSPDGRQIAFIEGLMSDETSTGNDIFTINSDGGEARNLTPDMRASASWLSWMPDGKRLLFAQYVGGDRSIATFDPATGHSDILFTSGETVYSGDSFTFTLSVAADGKSVAVIRNSFRAPPEVWAGSIGDWKQITRRNQDLKPLWGEAKSLQWKNDGHDIQGWLLYPRYFDPSKKYPLVVNVHGGPAWIAQPHWPGARHDFATALAGLGYFVFYPNPRGSFGQGEAFVRANIKDFGYGDFRDILSGVEEAIRVAPIDPNRLGITGWSYGGYMTMWAVTQTDRFKAAMAGAGLANFQSYYGQNKIDQWMIPYFGKSVYEDPGVYARSSPITFIKNVKTPTLILVGDSDGECPTPQSYEFWHALKTLGVETQFVVYSHEGHMFTDPSHQRDVIERTLSWFDAHLR
jgi:dipeptidyl aminopeptidase/acylaminoacyl peptidase